MHGHDGRVPGCMWQYVKWADRNDLDDFWTDAKVKRLFKNHIDSITSRVNIYNGARMPATADSACISQMSNGTSVPPAACMHVGTWHLRLAACLLWCSTVK